MGSPRRELEDLTLAALGERYDELVALEKEVVAEIRRRAVREDDVRVSERWSRDNGKIGW